MKQNPTKVGLGSTSLLLFICGLLFAFSFTHGASYGDRILTFVGLHPWSNGDTGLHYTMFYSLVFYIPALILGYKFRHDIGAKVGRVLSLTMTIILLVAAVFLVAV